MIFKIFSHFFLFFAHFFLLGAFLLIYIRATRAGLLEAGGAAQPGATSRNFLQLLATSSSSCNFFKFLQLLATSCNFFKFLQLLQVLATSSSSCNFFKFLQLLAGRSEQEPATRGGSSRRGGDGVQLLGLGSGVARGCWVWFLGWVEILGGSTASGLLDRIRSSPQPSHLGRGVCVQLSALGRV